jgi:hypothetical protein
MSRSSSGDTGGVDPYTLPAFYTVHWFSQRQIYTPKARAEFRRREIKEEKQLALRGKADLVNWKIK